jgi:hypothetical protein
MTETVDQTRYRRGLAKLAELGGDAGEEIAPMGDLGRYIAEFGLGDKAVPGSACETGSLPRSRCLRPWAAVIRKCGTTWARRCM